MGSSSSSSSEETKASKHDKPIESSLYNSTSSRSYTEEFVRIDRLHKIGTDVTRSHTSIYTTSIGASNNTQQNTDTIAIDAIDTLSEGINKSVLPNEMCLGTPGVSNNIISGRSQNSDIESKINTPKKIQNVQEKKNELTIDLNKTSKHNIFLKKLIGTFNENCLMNVRGFYCSACDEYLVFTKKNRCRHDESEVHRNWLEQNQKIRYWVCRTCKAAFYGDQTFRKEHLEMELHQFIADKPNNTCDNTERHRGTGPRHDHLLIYSSEHSLTLTKELKENFLKRLVGTDDGYSFYCHSCLAWFESSAEWAGHNDTHNNDTSILGTFKNCRSCKLMMIGSEELKKFHGGYEEHTKFKEFLTSGQDTDNAESRENDGREKENSNANCQNQEPDKGRTTYTCLLIKDLPQGVSRKDIFNYFKDFGRVNDLKMNFCAQDTALIKFNFRSIANNIVRSGLPIIINGKKITVQLHMIV